MTEKPDFMMLCTPVLQKALLDSANRIAAMTDVERMEIFLDALEEQKPKPELLSLVYYLIHAGDKAKLHNIVKDISDVSIN